MKSGVAILVVLWLTVLLATSGCVSSDQVNPDMKVWAAHFMVADPFLFDFKFPVHMSKEMTKKDYELSGMRKMDMEWLKGNENSTLIIKGYFERRSDWIPSFEVATFLIKTPQGITDLKCLGEEFTKDDGWMPPKSNSKKEILGINNGNWLHIIFMDGTNTLVGHENYYRILNKDVTLAISGNYFPSQKPDSKWLLERQDILRKVVDNFKIERKSEEKK